MRKPTAFIEELATVYSDPRTEQVRSVSQNAITHHIAHPQITIDSVYVKWMETYVLSIAKNTMFDYIPEYYAAPSGVAKMVFDKLELLAARADICRPLSSDAKQAIITEITKGTTPVTFKTTKAGERESLNACKINNNGIRIEAYEDFATCQKNPFYHAVVRTDAPRPPLPEKYNSFNSNDGEFAHQLYTLMKSHVK